MNDARLFRKSIIEQGRCMVRVRYRSSDDLTTAAICPGCWNDHNRRQTLLKKMEKMDVEPVHKQDFLSGTYQQGKKHSPQCSQDKNRDRWDQFIWRLKPKRYHNKRH